MKNYLKIGGVAIGVLMLASCATVPIASNVAKTKSISKIQRAYENASKPIKMGQIKVINKTSRPFISIIATACKKNKTSYRMESGKSLQVGESFTFKLAVGCWTVKVVTSKGSAKKDITLKAAELVNFTVTTKKQPPIPPFRFM